MQVLLTIDVEVWVTLWGHDQSKFPEAYSRFILGKTPRGDYGLPFQLRLLGDHGLKAVFFVESISASGFGLAQLRDTVALIREAGQEVQLHTHCEWLDKFDPPLIKDVRGDNMCELALGGQIDVMRLAMRNLEKAGVKRVTGHRAGNYGANRDTLRALREVGIDFDTSYNACADVGGELGAVGTAAPFEIEGVREYPVTVFRDGFGKMRPLQVRACASSECEQVLSTMSERGDSHAVIVSHGFELLNRRMDGPDPVVVRRFEGLCRFLSANADLMPTAHVGDVVSAPAGVSREPVRGRVAHTLRRYAEQGLRRLG